MANRGLLVVFALVCLLVMAGLGAWLLMDDNRAVAGERPMIPRVQR
jgi:hypothetical protein